MYSVVSNRNQNAMVLLFVLNNVGVLEYNAVKLLQ